MYRFVYDFTVTGIPDFDPESSLFNWIPAEVYSVQGVEVVLDSSRWRHGGL